VALAWRFNFGVKPVLRLLLVALLACALAPLALAQVVNRPPVPEWISRDDTAAGQIVLFRREFNAPTPLLKSVLLGACEGRMDVFVNGARVGEIASTTNATGFDVTGHLRPGANVLLLRAANPTGLAKAAVLLELNADLARQTWISSDTNWSAALSETALTPAQSLGRVDADAKANPFTPDKALDAYNSWKLARAGTAATDPATFTLLPGFKAELLRSAMPEEGSWIALAFDPQGRLTLAREKKGLLRFTLDSVGVAKVEVINDTLLECRGLLYAHGALYANANNSKTLVRLRDTKGTGQFDELTELLKTEGGVGHGRNHLKLGPDGWLWVAHGNNVHLPKNLSTNSPLRNFAHDRLIPCPWDAGMFDGDVLLPAGHILRMKPDGSEVQLWAGGLRNPLDIAFNEHGDLFTFDADMEWDVGCPWYVPNRVLHVVPGADYGWRRATARWPAWYPDTLPSVVDIGLASPTGVIFGHGAKFPEKYQRALFICDWAYGRILAVHLTPQGASYTGKSELFIGGRPMNVTDACIGPDGAMWFTTGGRGTQSGLYRISFREQITPPSRPTTEELDKMLVAQEARTVRKVMETGAQDELRRRGAISNSKFPSYNEPFLKQAARYAFGKMPTDFLRQVFVSDSFLANSESLGARLNLALTRLQSDTNVNKDELCNFLCGVSLRTAPEETQVSALRVLALTFIRLGPPDETQRQASLNWLEPLYPNASPRVNQMLVELLVYLRSPQVVAKTVPLLRAATASEDLLHYPFYLRYAREGWTPDARRAVFDALDRAERLPGGRTYFSSIANVRKELLATLTQEERTALGKATAPTVAARADLPAVPPPRFVKDWKLADLEPRLAQVSKGRSHEGARTALVAAQCVHCHRVSNDPAFPNSVIGPELLAVGARFSRRDLLFHILEPSAVIDEKFRQPRLLLTDGDVVSGAIEREEGGKLFVRPNPLEEKLVEVPLTNIRERRVSEVSPMPTGLLNGLRLEQILDLLAYLEATGNPHHRNFQP
jgi:putative heme-binding domain-containing protein